MSNKETTAKSWEVATARKKNGKTYLVFDQKVKLTVNGRELDLGEFSTAYINDKNKMKEDIEFKVGKGWLTEEQADKALETMEEKNIVGNIRLKFKE